jgi:hypothetical protein
MKSYWGVEAELQAFLTSALEGREWSVSHLDHFTPEKKPIQTLHRNLCIGKKKSQTLP